MWIRFGFAKKHYVALRAKPRMQKDLMMNARRLPWAEEEVVAGAGGAIDLTELCYVHI